MKVSALHIARWVEEARAELLGAKIESLHKDEHRRCITIDLYRDRSLQIEFLFLPGVSILYFANEGVERSGETTNFLPQIVGARISSIDQINFDRIVDLGLTDDRMDHRLVFELFGPKCNMYLLASGNQIVTSLRISEGRDTYAPLPPPPGVPPTLATQTDLHWTLTDPAGQSTVSALRSAIRGCDSSFWEIVSSSCKQTECLSVEDTLRVIETAAMSCIAGNVGVAVESSELRWSHSCDDSLNAVLAEYAGELARTAATNAVRQRLSSALHQRARQLSEKIEKLRRGLAEAEDADKYRMWAELLTINIKKLRRGMTVIAVVNLYDESQSEIAIPLSGEHAPSANIQRLFKKARKLKDSVQSTVRLLSETEQLHRNAVGGLSELEQCTGATELLRLERTLVKSGLIKPPKREKPSRKSVDAPVFAPRSYTTSAGEVVLVGRNALENEFVTFTAAKKHDFWFHSQQTSGSHVILKLTDRNKPPSQKSIIEAAEIAAHFSQARTSAKVPIIYTEVRHLHKIKGSTPGLVKYSRVTSIMVEPKLPKE